MIVDRYYYNQLNKQDKIVYKALYTGVKEHKAVIPLPIRGVFPEKRLMNIFHNLTDDNPLMYYLNPSMCNIATDMFGNVAVTPQYFSDADTVKKHNHRLQDIINNLALQLQLTEGSDYEKVIKVHDWICKNIEYYEDSTDPKDLKAFIRSHHLLGVFVNHVAYCDGIAKAVKVLLNAVDVKCIVVSGMGHASTGEEPHAWNIVNIDGKPYHFDATWDIGAGENKFVAYDYCNVTDSMISVNHKWEGKLPDCNSTEDNYFVSNRICFDRKMELERFIRQCARTGRKEFYFRYIGREKVSSLVNSLSQSAMEVLNDNGVRVSRCMSIPNDEMRVCRIKLY